MNFDKEAKDHWTRALEAWEAAAEITKAYGSIANRCYYAAFHAVSALFALEGRSFRTHAGVHHAVNRDLVKAGKWSEDIGSEYNFLLKARRKGDYGGGLFVNQDEACHAREATRRILQVVHKGRPDIFPLDVRTETDKDE